MRKWLRRYTPDHTAVHNNRWLAPFRNTLLHPRLWHLNRHSTAGGVATGLFCGLIPGPFQMFGAAICAVVFRINLPLALVTTLYTNPFTIVPLYLVAYMLGEKTLALGGSTPQAFIAPPEYGDPGSETLYVWIGTLIDWMERLGAPLALGLVLLASLLAGLGYLVVRIAYRIHLVRAWHRRRLRHAKGSIPQ